jgi:hypothetical protein
MKRQFLSAIACALFGCFGIAQPASGQDYRDVFFAEAPSDGGVYVKANTYFYNGYTPGKGNGWVRGGSVRWISKNVVEISNDNGTKSYYCRSSITSKVGYCTAHGWSSVPQ